MSINRPWTQLALLVTSGASAWYGQRRGIPGMEFARFGRQIGAQMLLSRARPSFSYLVAPIDNCTRYFELPFALSCVPVDALSCLDVGSPCLFSLYVATKRRDMNIRMINPDVSDCAITRSILSHLRLPNIQVETLDLLTALKGGETYDCIWSLSVIEHIAGKYDDRDAVQGMYQALKPGGRLILTTDVDREAWDEYRDEPSYGLRMPQSGGRYFFERRYDKTAVSKRLADHVGKEPSVVRWFGEIVPGHFSEYLRRWRNENYHCLARNPSRNCGSLGRVSILGANAGAGCLRPDVREEPVIGGGWLT